MDKPQNPLQKYMRHADTYVRIPSNGYFNEDDTYPFSPNREIGIAAMTAYDELLLKTPDAMLNGESIVKIIESCVPGIRNVRLLPIPDISVILLGIKMASYGDKMEFQATCPKCQNNNHFESSLQEVLATMKFHEESYVVDLSSKLKVSVKPHTYESSVKQALFNFNESQILKILTDDTVPQEKQIDTYTESMKKMAVLLTELTAESIISVLDPNGIPMDVTREQIFEWITNIPKHDAKAIQKKIEEINIVGIDATQKVFCGNEECKHKWKSQIGFNPTDFFD